jgi:hypothetical protein
MRNLAASLRFWPGGLFPQASRNPELRRRQYHFHSYYSTTLHYMTLYRYGPVPLSTLDPLVEFRFVSRQRPRPPRASPVAPAAIGVLRIHESTHNGITSSNALTELPKLNFRKIYMGVLPRTISPSSRSRFKGYLCGGKRSPNSHAVLTGRFRKLPIAT